MNTKTIFMTILLLTVLLIPSVSATDTTKLSLDVMTYEPRPVQPGQYVTITMQLSNNGNEEADHAVVEAIDQFPFTIIDKKIEEVGTLKSQRSYVYDIKAKVSSEAVVGDNELKLRYTDDKNSGDWFETSKNIKVESTQATMNIENVNIEPEEFIPGQEGTISIEVKNTADIVLRDASARLNLIENNQAEAVELPFTPIQTSEKMWTEKFRPEQIKEAKFVINVDAKATPGYYKIPVTLTFYDEKGVEYTKTSIIGVPVKAQPELDVFLDSTTIPATGTSGEMTLKFVNKGIHNLKFLDVMIAEGKGYEVLSNKKDYIGDLDSDDYRTLETVVKVTNENAIVDVNTKYKDQTNKEYEKTFSIPVEFDRNQEDENGGLSTTSIILLVIIVLLIGQAIYKRKKRK
ncbi:MAG: COG1361 S-layer family protein [Nanoarchaeota archaeon]